LLLGGYRRIRLEPVQVGLDKRVLGREVLVEGAGRDVGGIDERGDPGRVDAVPVEQLGGGAQDPLAGAPPAAGV